MSENKTIKAIETVYNGYRFRSRLEARWAVFFDALGVKYEYEPEGYELSDGTKYLPDFYLPYLDYFVEVKGMNNHLQEDIEKLVQFVVDNKSKAIILSEIPYSEESEGLYLFPIINYQNKSGSLYTTEHGFFIPYLTEDAFVYFQDSWIICCQNKWDAYKTDKRLYNDLLPLLGAKVDNIAPAMHQIRVCFKDELRTVQNAVLKARQARFEHGEKP